MDARQVSFEEGKELADHYNLQFIETSAKNNFNVEEAFNMLAQKIMSRDDISQFKIPNLARGSGTAINIKPSVSNSKIEEKKKRCY